MKARAEIIDQGNLASRKFKDRSASKHLRLRAISTSRLISPTPSSPEWDEIGSVMLFSHIASRMHYVPVAIVINLGPLNFDSVTSISTSNMPMSACRRNAFTHSRKVELVTEASR